MNAIDTLIAALSRLPGIGKKSAGRLAYHILETGAGYAGHLSDALINLHRAIKRCSICGSWTETDPCPVCTDPARDSSIICVVERAQDVRVIEESREFHGHFHVLGGLIAPLDGIGPNELNIGRLVRRIQQGGVKEIIIALNPTVEGDTTALYLQKMLEAYSPAITRLASGLPVGFDIEYADRLTLAHSLRGRVQLGAGQAAKPEPFSP